MYRIILRKKYGNRSRDYSIIITRRRRMVLDKIGFLKFNVKLNVFEIGLKLRRFCFWLLKGLDFRHSNKFCLNLYFYYLEQKQQFLKLHKNNRFKFLCRKNYIKYKPARKIILHLKNKYN